MSVFRRIFMGGGAGDNVSIIDPPPPIGGTGMPPRDFRDPFTSQAGIYTLPFTRQQLVNPRPTATDPNNLMDRLNALYSRTITPYLPMPEEDSDTGTGDSDTGGGDTGGGGGDTGGGGDNTGGGDGGGDDFIPGRDGPDRQDIIDDIRRRREEEERRRREINVPPLEDRFADLQRQISDLRDNPFSPPPFDPSILEKDILNLREQVAGIPALIPEIPDQFDPSGLQEQIDILNRRDMIQVPPPFDPRNLQSQIDKLSLGLGDLTRNISDDRLTLMDNILDEVDNRFSPQRLGMGMRRAV